LYTSTSMNVSYFELIFRYCRRPLTSTYPLTNFVVLSGAIWEVAMVNPMDPVDPVDWKNGASPATVASDVVFELNPETRK